MTIPPIEDWNRLIFNRERDRYLHENRMELFGTLLRICTSDELRKNISIKSFFNWLKPAVYHDQVLLLKTRMMRDDNGYITWAWVDDKTLDKYLTKNRFTLHPSEWNEGSNLVVIDFCVNGPKFEAIRMLCSVKDTLLSEGAKSVNICVRDEMGVVAKIKRWKCEKNN